MSADTQERIAQDIAAIRKDMDMVLHGNGRRGVWALSDAVFGHKDKLEPGLLTRVKQIEDRHKEQTWLQRGIAIGVALVLVDGLFDLNVSALIARAFGQ